MRLPSLSCVQTGSCQSATRASGAVEIKPRRKDCAKRKKQTPRLATCDFLSTRVRHDFEKVVAAHRKVQASYDKT